MLKPLQYFISQESLCGTGSVCPFKWCCGTIKSSCSCLAVICLLLIGCCILLSQDKPGLVLANVKHNQYPESTVSHSVCLNIVFPPPLSIYYLGDAGSRWKVKAAHFLANWLTVWDHQWSLKVNVKQWKGRKSRLSSLAGEVANGAMVDESNRLQPMLMNKLQRQRPVISSRMCEARTRLEQLCPLTHLEQYCTNGKQEPKNFTRLECTK